VEGDARVQGGDHVLHDLGLAQAEVGRLGAVDVDDILGIVEPLDDPRVDDALDDRQLVGLFGQ
jgi:hypothetical protein